VRLQGTQRRLTDRILGALSADESFDRPVLQQDRLVTGVSRGRLLRAHDGRVHKRSPGADQLLCTLGHLHR
jgi:hypothetical protein